MSLRSEITELLDRLEAAPVMTIDWEAVAEAAARLGVLAERRKSEVAVRAMLAAAVERVLEFREALDYLGMDATPLKVATLPESAMPSLAELRNVLEKVGAHIANRPSSLQALRAMERELEQLAANASVALAATLRSSAPDAAPVVVGTSELAAPASGAAPQVGVVPGAERAALAQPCAVEPHGSPPEPPSEPLPCSPGHELPPVPLDDAAGARSPEHDETESVPDLPPDVSEATDAVGERERVRIDESNGAPEARAEAPEERWYRAGVERFSNGDLPAANLLLTAAMRRPALPVLAVLEHVTFSAHAVDVPRPSSRVLETAVADLQSTVDEWTETDALLACTLMATLCVIDGLQDAGAPECLQRAREAVSSCPRWLEPFLTYWDATHRPMVALRPFVVDEQAARAAYAEARARLGSRIGACRGTHFTFSAGNRFVGNVFPDRGGPFGWVDEAVADATGDTAGRLVGHVEQMAALDPDRFIDAQCRELGQPTIVAAARSNITSKLEALREAVQAWRLAAEALRNVGTQSSAFFAKQFRELRREIAAVEPPPEDREPEFRIVHRCATKMLSRARLVIEGRG
jgi:hypothetical protein